MHELKSREDYLERILMLQERHNRNDIRAIDIAKDMSYSKASVSIALKKLKEANLIIVDDKTGIIKLTKEGYDIAFSVYERHQLISKWLIHIGVSEETALKDACLIEHDLSDETYAKLKEFVAKIN